MATEQKRRYKVGKQLLMLVRDNKRIKEKDKQWFNKQLTQAPIDMKKVKNKIKQNPKGVGEADKNLIKDIKQFELDINRFAILDTAYEHKKYGVLIRNRTLTKNDIEFAKNILWIIVNKYSTEDREIDFRYTQGHHGWILNMITYFEEPVDAYFFLYEFLFTSMIQIDMKRHEYWFEKTKQPNLILLASIFVNPHSMKDYMDKYDIKQYVNKWDIITKNIYASVEKFYKEKIMDHIGEPFKVKNEISNIFEYLIFPLQFHGRKQSTIRLDQLKRLENYIYLLLKNKWDLNFMFKWIDLGINSSNKELYNNLLGIRICFLINQIRTMEIIKESYGKIKPTAQKQKKDERKKKKN